MSLAGAGGNRTSRPRQAQKSADGERGNLVRRRRSIAGRRTRRTGEGIVRRSSYTKSIAGREGIALRDAPDSKTLLTRGVWVEEGSSNKKREGRGRKSDNEIINLIPSHSPPAGVPLACWPQRSTKKRGGPLALAGTASDPGRD